MWWRMEKVTIGKAIYDLWVKKASISEFGFAWSKRVAVEGKTRAVKPADVCYSSIEAAFAGLYRFATELPAESVESDVAA